MQKVKRMVAESRAALEVEGGVLQYLVKRSVSVSPWGGRAAGRGRGDLAVGALLP